ncbi:hypothetical protein GCM10023116_08850 [Kistimonas scapharcae]|uniref:Uncharacterized protein n=2 Tax=Kistimonas scapharcae TaxID=1036133 RepID=A0ABP8UYL4_9GAMM
MYNGCLLVSLIDLGAKEAIESIRAAFARDAVDYLFAGDLEDVEIALGLRDERATPSRDHMGEAFPFLAELRESMNHLSDEDKLEALGRNAPCPCGSGKKHKKCCLS